MLGSVVADSYGVWIFTPATVLVDGKHNITATATSPSGEISQPTGAFNFEVDTKAPNAVDPLVIKDNVGDHTGALISGDTTDDNTPTFEGQAEANSTITIYDNGNVIGSTTADADGKWSFTPNESLTDGDYTFSTTVTDAAGNTSAASPDVHITIDSSAVAVSITKLVDNVGTITGNITPAGVTDDTRPDILGEGKSGSVIKVYDKGSTLLGSTTVKSDGSWSFTPASDLSEGPHSITAIATDKVGNISLPTSAFEFSIDITAPAIPTIESAQDDVGAIQGTLFSGDMTDDPTPTLVGKAENGSIVKVYDGSILLGSTVANGVTGEWHFTPATPISEGAHKFHVSATDAAGNTSKPSADFILTTDYTAPDISKLAITDVDDQVGLKTGNVLPGETTDDTRPTINGTGTKGDTVIVFTTDSSGKHEIGRATVDANGKWHLKPVSPLLPGKNDFTAIEVDPVGNQAGPSAEYRILINTLPPEPPVIERVEDNVNNVDGLIVALQKYDVTDDNTPTIIGSAVANGIVTIYNKDVAIGSAKVGADSQWTFTPSPALADGKYEIRASVTDTIGRTSEKTGPFDFTVDTIAPGKATDLVVIDNEGDWTGALTSGDTTDDSTPTFTGKAEANGTVTIYSGNTVVGKTDANSNGDWTFTPSTALADGDYTFTIKVTDKAGNTGAATDKFNLTIDTSKVTVKIVKLLDDVGDITGPITPNTGVTDDTRPEVIGEGKTGSVIKVYDGENLLGSTSVKADGSWSFTPSSDLGQGSHSITATATDKTGNTSPKTSPFVFEIDSVKPSVPTIDSAIDDVGTIQGTLNNHGWTDDPTPTLMGKAEKGSIVKVYDGEAFLGSVTANATTGEWSFTPVSGLSEGEHKFHVTATDKAGNVSDKSTDFILTMDFTAPDPSKLAITGVDDQVGGLTGNVASGGLTDDSRPTISGTGTKGDLITVYSKDSTGNHVIGSATVGANDRWSLQPISPLLGGLNELTAVETDPVGNATSPSTSYTITLVTKGPATAVIINILDDVGTIIGEVQKGGVTDDNKPTINGTADKNSVIKIYDDVKLLGSVVTDSKGEWHFTPAKALTDGIHNLTATSTDAIGQTSPSTGIFDIIVDTTAPAKVENLVVIDDVGAVTGPLKSGDITDDSMPTFSGKAEANGKVTIYDNGVAIGNTTANASGNWSFTPSTALSDGTHPFTITVTDKAGNEGESTAFKLIIDTSTVTVSITALIDDVGDITGNIAQNGVTDDTRPEITGKGKENSIVKVYDGSTLLGSTTVDSNGKWSFTPTADLGQGGHSITVTATDLVGNTTKPTSAFVFNIDTAAPNQPTIDKAVDDVGTIQGDLMNGAMTDDPTPTLIGKAEAGSLVKVYDGNVPLGSVTAAADGKWSYTPTTGISEGKHEFHVTATDKAGNVSLPSADFVLTTDYTPPDIKKLAITGVDDQVGGITGNVVSGGETDDNRPTISGTGTKGDLITVYSKDSTGNHVIGSTIVDTNGKWSMQPTSPLLGGLNELTAVESDPVGNSTVPSAEYNVTLITKGPGAPVIVSVVDDVGTITGTVQKGGVTDDSKPTISGTADKGHIIKIYDDVKLLGSVVTDSKGEWHFTPANALIDGVHNLTATATDAIGQTGPATGIFDIIVDTTAPGKVSNLVVIDDVGAVTGPLKSGDITDDSTPTFSGKAEANGKVIIYDNGTMIGSTMANASGDWSFTPSTSLPDGSHPFTITVTDKAGNQGEAVAFNLVIDSSKVTVSIIALIDDVGTITGNIAQNGVTDDTRPEITGKGKEGSIINVYDGAAMVGSTTVDSNGKWSFTPVADMGSGEHSITATATDKTGNTSPKTSPFVFTIDTLAPTQPTIDKAIDDVGTIQGDLVSGAMTDDSTPTLVGKAEANSLATVYDGSVTLGSVTATADGKWTYTPTTAISEGKHEFHVTATDKAGNLSVPSANFVLITDYTAPDPSKLAITGVDDQVGIITGNIKSGGVTDDSRPTISGTGTKDDIITVYTTDSTGKHVIGSTIVDANGKWSLRPAAALAQGENKFTAVETDPVGNSTEPCAPYTITLDTFISDAKVTITAITEDRGSSSTDFITNDNTLLISGTLDKALKSDETVEITLDSGKTWTKATTLTDSGWTVDLQSKVLADGDYTIKARVVDTAGNVGSTDSHSLSIITESRDMNGLSTTAKITTDTSHGLVAGDLFSHSATLTNTDMVTRDRNVTVTGTLSAALLTGEKLQISLDDGATWKTLTLSGNNWSYALPEVSADTTYNFRLQVIDNAGNLGRNTKFAENYKVSIDLTVPDMITAAPDIAKHVSTKDAFTFDSSHYGTVEAGTIVALVSDENRNGSYQEGLDQVLGFAKANADGSWSMTTKLPAGAHNLAFMVWDEAGNHSSMGAATSVGVTDGEGSLLITQKWGGTTDSDGRGLSSAAVTISQDGLWSFFQSVRGTSGTTTANAGRVYTATDRENYESTYLAQPSTSNGAGYDIDSNTYSRYVNSAVFADINRDGYTDVMSQVSSYQNAGRTAYWMQNADGTFSPKAVDQGTLNHLGGVIAYDREGDGYLDFVLADSEADSISFLKNDKGVLSYEKVSGFDNGHPGGAIPAALSIMHEVGAVDIDNNGTVDITAHIDYNGVGNFVGNTSRGLGILYNQLTNNGSGKTNFSSVGYYANVFTNDGHEDYGNLSISMTYADFNGDGWLDLFLSRGSKAGANSDESRIYLNDGTGRLIAQDSQALWFGDNLAGGTSLAVDWNHDGKMDIIEIPRSGVNGSPTLYTNLGTDVWNGGGVSLTGSTKFDNITGAVALDYDWDGSMDIVLYRSGSDAGVVSSTDSAPTLLVKNTNIAADGTSLQIRIVDGFGINTYYSNTVKLYDSKGACVATQLINPQASGSSNSMGLVSFFGLDPNEVYSVQLLRITNGVTDHVGAVPLIGGLANNTVNANWGGLTTSKSHDAYVLTAESLDANNNTVGTAGIIGTGYNDTFFGSGGNDTYTGGGGWNLIVSGQQVWSETAGLDIVDYSRSASAITANLATGVATGWGTDKLVSIEGLIGSAQGDTFTDNAANNLFEGRGGNDTFYLTNGGNDVLMYKVLTGKSGDGRGGNGHDTVYGFTVGNLLTNNNADLIDLGDVLNYSGSYSCFMDEGKMTLDFASQGILNYLKVEQLNGDTIISIDRDGKGGAYGFEELLTLKGVSTDLVTLLSNNQIEVGDDTLSSASSSTHSLLSTTQQSLLSISQMYTAGDDILFGTDKADILMGGLGNDTFIHIGTGDQVMGGAGNDIIKLASTDFAYISGDEGIDTLILEGKNELLDLSALKDKLESIEIFDMGDSSNTMKVSLDDVLRLGSEELAIHRGDKAIIVNGEEGSTLKLENGDSQWAISQSAYQYQGNTYNVWTMGVSGVEVLVENSVNPIIM
ncbi:Ig-like domain repeat protein [Budviciaceae bacterium BWR-B9]|uniref:Ig-like domain repeat protein n=1 Tax=Limnobaculum allomyrinae TaxID=2791986 RepID=A0ABS1IPM2_9GAMM|nr:Ig-like domain repeat protein [Limnobaculum allomyrinae]MBV7692712.1 Ig-like domain repeat protein [Limnobaculum sp. M2-1]